MQNNGGAGWWWRRRGLPGLLIGLSSPRVRGPAGWLQGGGQAEGSCQWGGSAGARWAELASNCATALCSQTGPDTLSKERQVSPEIPKESTPAFRPITTWTLDQPESW